MSLSHCIHQTLNSKASTRFHSGGLQQSRTLILNTFLFGVIILIANILKRAFSSQLAAKLRNRLLVLRSEERFSRNAETDLVCRLLLEKKKRCTCWRGSRAVKRNTWSRLSTTEIQTSAL